MDIEKFKVIDTITTKIPTYAEVRDHLNIVQAKGDISHITVGKNSATFYLKLSKEMQYQVTLEKPVLNYSSTPNGDIVQTIQGYENDVSKYVKLLHSKDAILNLAKVSNSDKQYSYQELLKAASDNLEKSKFKLYEEMQKEQPIIPLNQMVNYGEIAKQADADFKELHGTPHNPYIHGPKHNTHYWICVDDVNYIDYYAIARLLGITDPNVQHAFKKLFALGKRSGGKDVEKDIREVIQSLELKLQLDKLIED